MDDKQFGMSINLYQRGNTLGLELPPDAVRQLGLRVGDLLEVRITDGSIFLRLPHSRKIWCEEELLSGITPEICGPDLIPDRVGQELL